MNDIANPKIVAIIVTYNSEQFIGTCLDSLLSEGYDNLEILVVDNDSKDKTIDVLADYKNIILIKRPNEGFGRSANLATEVVHESDYIFFLNPDTKIEIGFINSIKPYLIKYLNENVIIIPQQQTFNKEFLTCGNGMDIFGFSRWYQSIDEINKVFYADGAALVITKRAFEKLGGFDPDYFMFHEDVDLSWKAHLLGIHFIQAQDAIVYHWSGGCLEGGALKNGKLTTSTTRRYFGERNCLTSLLKNYSSFTLIWLLPISVIMNLCEMIFFLILLKPKISLCYIRAYMWNLSNLKCILIKRREIQNKRVVPDKEIMEKMCWTSAKIRLFLGIGLPKFISH